jgi:hypothetical protein
MTNRIRFAITLAGAVLCALPNLAIAQSGSGNSQGDQGADIEGTWVVTVDRVPQNTKFSSLTSFTAGGVILAIGTLDRLPAPTVPPFSPPISPLYGSWMRTGNNRYVATLNFLIFDSAGNAMLMFQNNQTYQLTDDNHLVGVGTACTWDIIGGIIQRPPEVPNGICHPVPGGIQTTITGTRLIAQGASN